MTMESVSRPPAYSQSTVSPRYPEQLAHHETDGRSRRYDLDGSCQALRSGLNFPLQTNAGPIDLFGEIAGGGAYAELRDRSIEVEVLGVRCLCLDLNMLIQESGRPRDLEAFAELEIIRDERPGAG